jgi:hypothetical protein
MKKLLLATTATLAFWAVAGPASAATFTLSDFAGTGVFGTATATDLGAQPGSTDTVDLFINMAPNVLIDTGSHFSLTLSLIGTGRIDPTSIAFQTPPGSGGFTVEAHGGSYMNAPFGNFTDALSADCSPSMGTGCGSTLDLHITNFQGFGAASNTFNGNMIFAAVDVLLANCTGGCTGVVGLTGGIPTQTSAVPGPIVGAGLPGIVAGCMTMLGLGRWRKRRNALTV